jgi:hypothetical protein
VLDEFLHFVFAGKKVVLNTNYGKVRRLLGRQEMAFLERQT